MENQRRAQKHAGHGISQFELSKKVLHNLKHFGLTPSAKLVLWVLSDCYNPENGSVVFPSIEFIAELADIGLTSAKQAIKELINKGLIIKSKRGQIRGNYNKYLITPKVQNPTSEQPENECFKKSETDFFMRTNKIGINKKQTTSKDVVVSLKNSSKKSVTLEDVPQIIKDNSHIDNPCGYWASLSTEAKTKYLQDQKAFEEKQKQRALIIKKQKEIKIKEKEEQRKNKEECNKPLTEQYTIETACNIIKNIANIDKRLAYRGIAKELTAAFNIDIENLLNNV